MAALFFLVGAALLGIGLIRRACGKWLDGAEQILWGLVLGWALATLSTYVLANASGRLSFALVGLIAVVDWLAAAALWFPLIKRIKTFSARSLWRTHYTGLLTLLIAFLPVFGLLVSSRMFYERADGIYSGGTSFYDLVFHAAVTHSFVYGQNFPPIYTAFPPEPLLYPVMADFLTAALMSTGLGLRVALVVTTLPLLLVVTGLVYSTSWRIVRSQLAASIGTLFFFFSGGLGFTFFYGDWKRSGEPLSNFWSGLERNYASMWDRGLHFGNTIADYLLPQHASLFGVPLALMVFACFAHAWRSWHADEKSSTERGSTGWRTLLIAGVIAALLPYFHVHSYLAVGLISIFLFALKPRVAWVAFWTPALLLGAPRVLALAFHAADADGFLRFQPGWMAGSDFSQWPAYWVRNVGLPLLLIIPAFIAAPPKWRKFYLAFVALFAVAILFVFSANDIDNLKIIYYWYAASCVLVGWWLSRLTKRRWALPFVVLVVILSIVTGVMALHHEGSNNARLFSRAEIEVANFISERTEKDALFLVAPAIHQAAHSLAGRPIVRGDARWLWSHGYDVRKREYDVRMIYAGNDALARVRRLGIDYIYLGSREQELLKVDRNRLERLFPIAFQNSSVTILDTRATNETVRVTRGWAGKLDAPLEISSALEDPATLFVEFKRIAFFIHKMYKISYGRSPRREEFLADFNLLAQRLTVPGEGWEYQLVENKKVFCEVWTTQTQFVSKYGLDAGNTFVDRLNANGGVELDRNRINLTGDPNGGEPPTQASIVCAAAEDRSLLSAEYARAFVLTHFFAYLRRNPDDPPDRDDGGLVFWLNELKRTRDYGSISRAFLESDEYKAKVYEMNGQYRRLTIPTIR